MSSIEGEVGAYHREHLEELSTRPNTTVLTVEHDEAHEPWKVQRLRPLLESLTQKVLSAPDDEDDFALRKRCLQDAETLAFQRQHPKTYWLLTDRTVMRDEAKRAAVTGLLFVREQVEAGAVREGRDADAMATRTVMAAMGAPVS